MRWYLNVDNFTLLDRLSVAGFVLNRNNRLTMGRHVEAFEKEMGDRAKSHALFTSSGSTANSLLVETYKQLYGNLKTVILPTTTWSTSVNPWIQAGFRVRFVDINLVDFSIDLGKLAETLAQEPNSLVFATSLIGFTPDIYGLQRICDAYKTELFLDNCENTLGEYDGLSLLSFGTNTTSTYFGHQLCSIEGGFLFTKDDKFYATAKMIRNHGLTRCLTGSQQQIDEREEWEAANPTVDPQFLFARVGNNFRNTEINALFGRLDMKRWDQYLAKRRGLYQFFVEKMDHERYWVPMLDESGRTHAPFCLPLICKDKDELPNLKTKLAELDIEYRPIVGGNLLAQPIYKPFDTGEINQNSRMLHNRGVYVGLHNKVSYSDINYLCESI